MNPLFPMFSNNQNQQPTLPSIHQMMKPNQQTNTNIPSVHGPIFLNNGQGLIGRPVTAGTNSSAVPIFTGNGMSPSPRLIANPVANTQRHVTTLEQDLSVVSNALRTVGVTLHPENHSPIKTSTGFDSYLKTLESPLIGNAFFLTSNSSDSPNKTLSLEADSLFSFSCALVAAWRSSANHDMSVQRLLTHPDVKEALTRVEDALFTNNQGTVCSIERYAELKTVESLVLHCRSAPIIDLRRLCLMCPRLKTVHLITHTHTMHAVTVSSRYLKQHDISVYCFCNSLTSVSLSNDNQTDRDNIYLIMPHFMEANLQNKNIIIGQGNSMEFVLRSVLSMPVDQRPIHLLLSQLARCLSAPSDPRPGQQRAQTLQLKRDQALAFADLLVPHLTWTSSLMDHWKDLLMEAGGAIVTLLVDAIKSSPVIVRLPSTDAIEALIKDKTYDTQVLVFKRLGSVINACQPYQIQFDKAELYRYLRQKLLTMNRIETGRLISCIVQLAKNQSTKQKTIPEIESLEYIVTKTHDTEILLMLIHKASIHSNLLAVLCSNNGSFFLANQSLWQQSVTQYPQQWERLLSPLIIKLQSTLLQNILLIDCPLLLSMCRTIQSRRFCDTDFLSFWITNKEDGRVLDLLRFVAMGIIDTSLFLQVATDEDTEALVRVATNSQVTSLLQCIGRALPTDANQLESQVTRFQSVVAHVPWETLLNHMEQLLPQKKRGRTESGTTDEPPPKQPKL